MNAITPYNIGILVDGARLPIYYKDGRYFVAGEPGKAYAIEMLNPRGQRLEILESVDGRNVLKDEAASLFNSGMIVSPYQPWLNSGWRIDDDHVRQFVFGSPGESIAAQSTGSVGGVGVIGMAVFAEKAYRVTNSLSYTDKSYLPGSYSRFDNSVRSLMGDREVKGAATPDSVSADLGTGMGAQVQDRVGHTTFVRESSLPLFKVEIQYRTAGWLEAHGILTHEPNFPSAWPDSPTGYEKYAR